MVLVRTRGNGNVKEAVEGETFAVVAAVSGEEVEGRKMGSEVVVVVEEEVRQVGGCRSGVSGVREEAEGRNMKVDYCTAVVAADADEVGGGVVEEEADGVGAVAAGGDGGVVPENANASAGAKNGCCWSFRL